MKTARATSAKTLLDDIVTTLKRVPKARLGAVRAVVQALADTEPAAGPRKTRPRKKGSLVESPFCGMWKDREDIADGQTFARQLRQMVESRGDRRKNVR